MALSGSLRASGGPGQLLVEARAQNRDALEQAVAGEIGNAAVLRRPIVPEGDVADVPVQPDAEFRIAVRVSPEESPYLLRMDGYRIDKLGKRWPFSVEEKMRVTRERKIQPIGNL